MPKKRFHDMGTVARHGEGCRAHLQYRDATGANKHICGPERRNNAQAAADLAQIRAAGGMGSSREEGLEFMAAEAMRIQATARYQAEIRETAHRLDSRQEESDEEFWHPNDND